MVLQAHAKIVLSLLGSAVLALIVAFILAAFSVSGVISMGLADVFLWLAASIFWIALLAVGIIYRPKSSRWKAVGVGALLLLIACLGWFGRSHLSSWLFQKKAEQEAREHPPLKPTVQPPDAAKPEPPKNAPFALPPIKTQPKHPKTEHAPGSIIQNNPNSVVNVQQGTTGANSPISNSPITVGEFTPSDRHLTDKSKLALHDELLAIRGKSFRIIRSNGIEPAQYADEIRSIFTDAAWEESRGIQTGMGAISGGYCDIEPPLYISASSKSDTVLLVMSAFHDAGIDIPFCSAGYLGPVSMGVPDVVINIRPQPKVSVKQP